MSKWINCGISTHEIRLLIRATTQVNLTDAMLRTGSQIQFHLCEVVECKSQSLVVEVVSVTALGRRRTTLQGTMWVQKMFYIFQLVYVLVKLKLYTYNLCVLLYAIYTSIQSTF